MAESLTQHNISSNMIFSDQQKKAFRRIQKKYSVSTDFLLYNKATILKFVNYVVSLHFVIRRKLVTRNNRVIIRHNCLRKYLINPPDNSESKKAKHLKKKPLSWNKKIIRYYRKHQTEHELNSANNVDFSEDDEEDNSHHDLNTMQDSELFSTQLKDQIVAMKSVSSEVPLLTNSLLNSDTNRLSDKQLVETVSTEASDKENAKFPCLEAIDVKAISEKNECSAIENERRNNEIIAFIDKLMYKFGSGQLMKNKSKAYQSKQKYIAEDTQSSDEFLGFSESEIAFNGSPVPTTSDNVLSPNNKFTASGELPNFRSPSLFKREKYPSMYSSSFNQHLKKPTSIETCIMESENIICRELHKRLNTNTFNERIVNRIQHGDKPVSRDCWKAMAWLLTQTDNYYYQILEVDKKYRVQILGGKGNFKYKYKYPQLSRYPDSMIKCPTGCKYKNKLWNLRALNFEEVDSIITNVKYKISDNSPSRAIPCPFSKKLEYYRKYESELGHIESFEMPKLEIILQLNRNMDINSKKLVNYLTIDGKVTTEFAKFAASALRVHNSVQANDFVFNIPYNKGQTHVIGRRIYKSSEPFEKTKAPLSFIENIKPDDKLAHEVSSVLNDIIDSVAITLSEDSLIQLDPDVLYNCTDDDNLDRFQGNVVIPPKKKPTLKNRLRTELKRLNATIIDAETTDEIDCSKQHCSLGCVCNSLNYVPLPKSHCQKPDCMINCTCNFCPTTDSNYSLSSQNARMLRKRATAKLARVEKEFTSTVVITQHETLIINDSEIERKRRCTKAPKRYDDYLDTIEECNNLASKQSKRISVQDEEDCSILWVDNKILKDLKHCTVEVNNLKNLNNVIPWCMFHHLYNCFCKCNALEGEPFHIRNDLFRVNQKTLDSTNTKSCSNVKVQRQRYDADIIERYTGAGVQDCKRVVSIPAKAYRRRNEKHSNNIRRKIEQEENDKTRFVLHQRINNSILFDIELYLKEKLPYYQKDVDIIQKKRLERKRYGSPNDNMFAIPKESKSQYHTSKRRKFSEDPLVVGSSVQDAIYKQIETISRSRKRPITPQHQESVIESPSRSKNINEHFMQMKSSSPMSSSSDASNVNQQVADVGTVKIPIIASVRSLSLTPQVAPVVFGQANDLIHKSVTQIMSADQRADYAKTIEKLNELVTKKMSNIQSTQRSNLKAIAKPSTDTLYIATCKNFCASFHNNTAHLWEVKTEKNTFFAVTIIPLMPVIQNALSIVNIKALKNNTSHNLISQLLFESPNHDNNMSILMHGFESFWTILGFIKSNQIIREDKCIKPTPSTHPWLTDKINILYQLLNKQKIINTEKQLLLPPVEHPPPPPPISQIVPATEQIVGNFFENYKNTEMNIEIRSVTSHDVPSLHIPKAENVDHRWLVLDLQEDFSHIVLPLMNNVITMDRIRKTLWQAKDKSKVVRLYMHNTTLFGCYATPSCCNKLYFGPFYVRGNGNKLEPKPLLLLFQCIDGAMLLREQFEEVHKITREKRTTAFWVLLKDRTVQFDLPESKNQNSIEENDFDEDCFIVENNHNTDHLLDGNLPDSHVSSVLILDDHDARVAIHTNYVLTPSDNGETFTIAAENGTILIPDSVAGNVNDNCSVAISDPVINPLKNPIKEKFDNSSSYNHMSARENSSVFSHLGDQDLDSNIVPKANLESNKNHSFGRNRPLATHEFSKKNVDSSTIHLKLPISNSRAYALQETIMNTNKAGSSIIKSTGNNTIPSYEFSHSQIGDTTIRKVEPKISLINSNHDDSNIVDAIPVSIIYKAPNTSPTNINQNRSLLKRTLSIDDDINVGKNATINDKKSNHITSNSMTSVINPPSGNMPVFRKPSINPVQTVGGKLTQAKPTCRQMVGHVPPNSSRLESHTQLASKSPKGHIPQRTSIPAKIGENSTTQPEQVSNKVLQFPRFRCIQAKPPTYTATNHTDTRLNSSNSLGLAISTLVGRESQAKTISSDRNLASSSTNSTTTSTRRSEPISSSSAMLRAPIERNQLPSKQTSNNRFSLPGVTTSMATTKSSTTPANLRVTNPISTSEIRKSSDIGQFYSQFSKLPCFPAKRLQNNSFIVKVSNQTRPQHCLGISSVNALINTAIKRMSEVYDPAWAEAKWTYIANHTNSRKGVESKPRLKNSSFDPSEVILIEDDD